MRTTITRTITTTTITCCQVQMIDKKPVLYGLDCLEVNGTVTQKEIEKFVKRAYGHLQNVIVTDISSKDVLYEMDIDDFIKYAKPVNNGEVENEQ